MAVVGPFAAFGIYRLTRALNMPFAVSVFLAAAIANLLTYITTSLQLALAFPDPVGGIAASFAKFAGIFAVTQIPLAISEGFLTVIMLNVVTRYNHAELKGLDIAKPQGVEA